MILPWVRARLYRNKTITALPIGQHASAAREIRVQRGIVLIHAMTVPSRRIGLPNLNQSSGNRAPFFISYSPADDYAFTEGLTAVLARQVVVVLSDVAMAEYGASELRQGVRQQDQRLFWITFARRNIRRVEVIRLRSGWSALVTGRFHELPNVTVTGERASGQAHPMSETSGKLGTNECQNCGRRSQDACGDFG